MGIFFLIFRFDYTRGDWKKLPKAKSQFGLKWMVIPILKEKKTNFVVSNLFFFSFYKATCGMMQHPQNGPEIVLMSGDAKKVDIYNLKENNWRDGPKLGTISILFLKNRNKYFFRLRYWEEQQDEEAAVHLPDGADGKEPGGEYGI